VCGLYLARIVYKHKRNSQHTLFEYSYIIKTMDLKLKYNNTNSRSYSVPDENKCSTKMTI